MCAGAALLLSTVFGLKPEDQVTALAPMASVSLNAIGKEGETVMKVLLPRSAQWQRIRRRWGAPAYVFSAVSPTRRDVYCLPDLSIGIEVFEQGRTVHIEKSVMITTFRQ